MPFFSQVNWITIMTVPIKITIKCLKALFLVVFISLFTACSYDQAVTVLEKGERLHFTVQEGAIYNEFYRQGPVAAHTVLTSGLKPRLIVAFPAGNSGVSLWFKEGLEQVEWQNVTNMSGVRHYNENGEPLYGIKTELTVSASQITVEKALLGSIRTIRNYMHNVQPPENISNNIIVSGNRVTWSRSRLDKKGGYKLSLEILNGHVKNIGGKVISFKAAAQENLHLRVVALTGDKPLIPLEQAELLNHKAAHDIQSRHILSFLSYKEKMLAGSWRFLTYFGRDTLLSLRMLMPVLKPEAIEAGLGSVIERLDAKGEVAHEEDIGEFAVLRHLQEDRQTDSSPIYDYKMIDDDYMLPILVAEYILDKQTDQGRVKAFLSRKTSLGQTYGEALVKNMEFILNMAAPFARSPTVENLIATKQDLQKGNWRDSDEGLGGGKYAYDVNAVFMPVALKSIINLQQSRMFNNYLGEKSFLMQAGIMKKIWREKAPAFFKVSIPASLASNKMIDYAKDLNVPMEQARLALSGEGVDYYAVSLDKWGNNIPIIQSDIGYMLLFDEPAEAEIEYVLKGIMRPFPAGLMTPVGLVVANPVFASDALKRIFTKGHYHGSVIWSWQQALIAAGLEHQLMRDDLSEPTRKLIMQYQNNLWQVIKKGREIQNSELWSWAIEDDEFTISPFGQGQGHMTESNAAQLWSTVYLAIRPPDKLH